MRTDVKVGLICAFAIVLCVVIYFVARGNRPATSSASTLARNDAPHVITPPAVTIAPNSTSDPLLPGRTGVAATPGSAFGGPLIAPPGAGSPTTPTTPGMGAATPTLATTLMPTTSTPGTPTLAGPVNSGGGSLIPGAPTPASTQPTLVISTPPGTGGLATTSGGATTYKIQRGDMLGPIAKKFGVTVKAIEEANPGIDSSRLKIDAVIKIPAATAVASTRPAGPATRPTTVTPVATTIKPGTTYEIKKGDTLTKIAKAAYGATGSWKKIFQANQAALSDPDVVPVGKQIVIPQ
jgi:nucleoid-associated protein YgaU